MKSIFRILSIFTFLLLPIVAKGDCGTNTTKETCEAISLAGTCIWTGSACTERCPTSNGTCESYSGCYMDEYECQPCPQNSYNNDSTGITNACSLCATENNAGTSWTWYNQIDLATAGVPYNNSNNISAGVIFDSANATYGQSSCPWICAAGYYKTGDTCTACPAGSTSAPGATSISECNCNSDAYKHFINGSSTEFDYCMECSQYSQYDSGTNSCICNDIHANITINTNTHNDAHRYTCACPGTNGGMDNNNMCACNPGYRFTQDNNGTWLCSACPTSNATPENNVCRCDANYYGDASNGDNNIGCIRCPAGSTKSAGGTATNPTNESDCHMSSNTQFCTSDGNSCFNFPNGATINQ